MTPKLYRLLSLLVLSLLLQCAVLSQSTGSNTGSNSGQNQQQPATEGNNSSQSQQQPSSGNSPNAQTGNAPGQDQKQQKEAEKSPDQKQEQKQDQDQDANVPAGKETGGYLIHQSIEIGYRGTDVTGSQPMYNSLVDLPSGPRLLEQTLTMQSPAHAGFLFDNLFVSSFGWGGDPNNAFNARLDKGKLYDFRAMFRADHNDFNYDLLANPLNPAISNPSLPVTSSPHAFSTRRRMYDYDLTLLPQSVVSFRAGYSRNNMTGPSFSSVHEGTDALLSQLWNTTLNSYRFGADFKILPRTVISYDQTFDYYKGDTSWQLAPFAPAFVPGAPGSVDLGLPIDTVNKNPCAATPSTASLIDATGTLTNLGCNGFFNYTRADHIRTSTPTERVSLHTNFSMLELNASYAYSNADMMAPVNEFFNGLSSRGRTRQTTVVGPGEANQISNVADFTATGHISQHFRVVETFRFWAYRIPSAFSSVETDFNVPGSGSCAPPSCSLLTPITATTPSLSNTADQLSFNQNWWRNQVDLVWDASKQFGARIGFRYGDRVFHRFLDFTTGDEDRTVIHEYTPLIAFWARPMHSLRLNFDWENTSNDATLFRVAPRKDIRYRFQANYTPEAWLVLGGSINLWQASNGDQFTNYRAHNRNYGFTAAVTRWKRFGFDFAYNYSNYLQSAFVCFNSSDTTNPVVAGAGSCTANGFDDGDNNLLIDGRYTNNTHYALGLVTMKPEPRLTLQVGYSINSVGGQAPLLNSLQPFGPLQYNYHQPLANVALDLGHNLTGKAAWNYYQYGEKSFVGPTDPRYFHANNATLSLRWGF